MFGWKKKKPAESPPGSNWFILIDDKNVGTLSNGQSEMQSEFWTVYDLRLTDAAYSKLATDADYWNSLPVHLIAQSNPSMIVKSFLTAVRPEGRIAIRILLD
jgi:hypothetical protein